MIKKTPNYKKCLVGLIIMLGVAVLVNVFFGYMVNIPVYLDHKYKNDNVDRFISLITATSINLVLLIATFIYGLILIINKKNKSLIPFLILNFLSATFCIAIDNFVNADVNVINTLIAVGLLILGLITFIYYYEGFDYNREQKNKFYFKVTQVIIILSSTLCIIKQIINIFILDLNAKNISFISIYISLSLVSIILSSIYFKNSKIVLCIISWVFTLFIILVSPVVFVLTILATTLTIFGLVLLKNKSKNNVLDTNKIQ